MRTLALFDWPLFIKGTLTVIMGFLLFVGSVYVLLAAVMGKKLGYLVLAVSFFGWMTLLSAIWAFGFYSQGLETPVNLGPKGVEPHWQPVEGGYEAASATYPLADAYPGGEWREPGEKEESSVDPVATSIKEFLAKQANEEAGIEPVEAVPEHASGTLETEAQKLEDQLIESGQHMFIPEDFIVQDVRFATAEDGETSLAAARAFYQDGGPEFTVVAYHDSGNVPIYSYIFLALSIVGLLAHLPFLDRVEAKRKDILTGGTAPVWRGPA